MAFSATSSATYLFRLLFLSAISLLVRAQTKPYNFTAPPTYQNCAYDPNAGKFIFVDARIGMPLVFSGDAIQVGKVSEATLNIPWYLTFTQVGATPSGIWDLTLHDPQVATLRYLSIYDDGQLGYEATSSGGQQWRPAADGKRRYISTVWSLECAGNLRAGILGSNGYEFDLLLKDNHIVTYPQLAGSVQTVALAWDVAKSGPLRPLSESDLVPELLVRTRDTVGTSRRVVGFGAMSRRQLSQGEQRCDPPKVAREKDGAPAPSTNGCGPDLAMHLGDYRFGSCCDAHDYCYDDCDAGWRDCNNSFRSCMFNTCRRDYSRKTDLAGRLACNTLANVYSGTVSSPIGLYFYHSAGEKRCECVEDAPPPCKPNGPNCCAGPPCEDCCPCLC